MLGTLALCALLTAASACDGASPREAASSTGDPTASAPASPTSTGPTAQPATGKRLRTPHASVNSPEGWTKPFPMSTADFKVQNDPTGLSGVTISDIGLVGSTADPETELRKVALNANGKQAKTASIDTDSMLDGELAAHASYEDLGQHHEVYGAFHLQSFVYVDWAFDPSIARADQQRIVEEGLASFRWR